MKKIFCLLIAAFFMLGSAGFVYAESSTSSAEDSSSVNSKKKKSSRPKRSSRKKRTYSKKKSTKSSRSRRSRTKSKEDKEEPKKKGKKTVEKKESPKPQKSAVSKKKKEEEAKAKKAAQKAAKEAEKKAAKQKAAREASLKAEAEAKAKADAIAKAKARAAARRRSKEEARAEAKTHAESQYKNKIQSEARDAAKEEMERKARIAARARAKAEQERKTAEAATAAALERAKESKRGQRKGKGKFTPFLVYSDRGARGSHFFPTGWMGDYGDLRVNPGYTAKVHSGQTSFQIQYNARMAQNAGWVGMYWQYPANNWGNRSGYNLTGARKLTFWACGERGGEILSEIKMGGISGEFGDSDFSSIGPIELSDKWQKYTINLANRDLTNVIGGFCFAAAKDDNPNGFTIYFDDIIYE
ncbi:hypothetical protein ACFL58_00555 [Elusimicrobiota bacterium]